MAQHTMTTKKAEVRSVNLRGISLGALIVGIVAVVTFWVPIWGFITGAAALTLGIIGLAKRAPHRGWSLAGTIMGGAAIFLSIAAFVLLIALGIYNSANNNNSDSNYNPGSGYQTDPFAN